MFYCFVSRIWKKSKEIYLKTRSLVSASGNNSQVWGRKKKSSTFFLSQKSKQWNFPFLADSGKKG